MVMKVQLLDECGIPGQSPCELLPIRPPRKIETREQLPLVRRAAVECPLPVNQGQEPRGRVPGSEDRKDSVEKLFAPRNGLAAAESQVERLSPDQLPPNERANKSRDRRELAWLEGARV